MSGIKRNRVHTDFFNVAKAAMAEAATTFAITVPNGTHLKYLSLIHI